MLQCRESQLLSAWEESQKREELTNCSAERGHCCQPGRKARSERDSQTAMQREAIAVSMGGKPELRRTHKLQCRERSYQMKARSERDSHPAMQSEAIAV